MLDRYDAVRARERTPGQVTLTTCPDRWILSSMAAGLADEWSFGPVGGADDNMSKPFPRGKTGSPCPRDFTDSLLRLTSLHARRSVRAEGGSHLRELRQGPRDTARGQECTQAQHQHTRRNHQQGRNGLRRRCSRRPASR
jgi:hypothetical protein